jgi:hypothetical protein
MLGHEGVEGERDIASVVCGWRHGGSVDERGKEG